jgi:hypothetical protein
MNRAYYLDNIPMFIFRSSDHGRRYISHRLPVMVGLGPTMTGLRAVQGNRGWSGKARP